MFLKRVKAAYVLKITLELRNFQPNKLWEDLGWPNTVIRVELMRQFGTRALADHQFACWSESERVGKNGLLVVEVELFIHQIRYISEESQVIHRLLFRVRFVGSDFSQSCRYSCRSYARGTPASPINVAAIMSIWKSKYYYWTN